MRNPQTPRAPRERRSGRIRALLSLGMLLGITQVGTLAAWTDSATVETGSFSTGTLDLQVGENSADHLSGPGGTWNHSSLTLSDLTPGESVAQLLTVGNGGSMPLTYTAAVSTADDALSGSDGLYATVTEDAARAVNAGGQSSNDRTGTCEGGSATDIADSQLSSSAEPVHADPVALAPKGTTTYCVIIGLSSDAPNTMQGKTSTVEFSFEAEQ